MLEPTQDQKAALDQIERGISASFGRPSVTVIAGYSGTGKTSSLKMAFDRFGQGIAIAPTGKAALRITEATGIPAQTAHRWLYRPLINQYTGGVDFASRKPDDVALPQNRTIFFDEASMLGQELYDDIYNMAHKLDLNIVLIGDNFQLPPVSKINEKPFSVFDTNFTADYRYQLTEIVRQAADNPIIKASMKIRQGKTLEVLYSGVFPRILQKDLIDKAVEVVKAGGAVICHRNVTRHYLNNAIREKLGYTPDVLAPNEPLMVTHNNYALGAFNGEVVRFCDWDKKPDSPVEIQDKYTKEKMNVTFGRGMVETIEGVKKCVLTNEEVFGKVDPAKITLGSLSFNASDKFQVGLPYLHTNLGYAATCHKYQGSENPEVLVVLENTVNLGRHEGHRWAYTAFTRSKDKVYVCSYH